MSLGVWAVVPLAPCAQICASPASALLHWYLGGGPEWHSLLSTFPLEFSQRGGSDRRLRGIRGERGLITPPAFAWVLANGHIPLCMLQLQLSWLVADVLGLWLSAEAEGQRISHKCH